MCGRILINDFVPARLVKILRTNCVRCEIGRFARDKIVQLGESSARGPFAHSVAIEEDQVGGHSAGSANEKAGGISGRITRGGLAFDNFVNRLRWIFLMSSSALGFEITHRFFDRSRFRPALGQINDFDEAGLVAFDCAFGIKEPKQGDDRSEEHTSELQSLAYLVCRLLLEKKKKKQKKYNQQKKKKKKKKNQK